MDRPNMEMERMPSTFGDTSNKKLGSRLARPAIVGEPKLATHLGVRRKVQVLHILLCMGPRSLHQHKTKAQNENNRLERPANEGD